MLEFGFLRSSFWSRWCHNLPVIAECCVTRAVSVHSQVSTDTARMHGAFPSPLQHSVRLQALKKSGVDHTAAVQLPVEPLPERESEDELLTLYIADFLHSFQKPLELPRLTVAELREGLSGDPEAASTALLRQTLFRLTSVRASTPPGMP